MPITPFLRNQLFDPELIQTMSPAFIEAWGAPFLLDNPSARRGRAGHVRRFCSGAGAQASAGVGVSVARAAELLRLRSSVHPHLSQTGADRECALFLVLIIDESEFIPGNRERNLLPYTKCSE